MLVLVVVAVLPLSSPMYDGEFDRGGGGGGGGGGGSGRQFIGESGRQREMRALMVA
jgi:hypothetical protein